MLKHDYLKKEADLKTTGHETTKGRRGEIYGARGRLLVSNMPCHDVSITPCNIASKDDGKLAAILATELELDYAEVLEKISRKRRTVRDEDGSTREVPVKYAQIAVNVPLEKSRALREKLKAAGVSRNVH